MSWSICIATSAIAPRGTFINTFRMEYLGHLIKNNIALCTFDFSACGNAEGEYVTMGYYEQEDVRLVIKYISKMIKIRNIGLWGRSIGAVSALLYLAKTI